MYKKDQIIWLDGQYLTEQEAAISPLTHSLHYGLGIFEGIRAYETEQGAAIFRGIDHVRRLFASARVIDMKLPYSQEELMAVQHELLSKNRLTKAYIRPLCFYGTESLSLSLHSLSVHVMVATIPWPKVYTGEENIKAKISSYARSAVNSHMLKAKITGNYLTSLLALQEAQQVGCQDALFLDQEGFVCEGSGANFFIVRDNILYTADSAYILEGITRDTIIHLANDHGLKVQYKRITRDEVYMADEAFLTGTAVEIVPIVEVDGRKIGSGSPGSTTQKLQQIYHQVIHGKMPRYNFWLDQS